MNQLFRTLVVTAALVMFVNRAYGREILLATMEYPPYTGETLPQKGYTCEIATKAFSMSGHKVSIKVLPWQRALEMTKKGLFDGILSLIYKKEREQWFLYTDPLPPIQFSFLKVQGRPEPAEFGVESLSCLKVGLVRGYAYPGKFETIKKKLNIELAADDAELLNMLLAGRVDLVFTDLLVANYIIRKQRLDLKGHIYPLKKICDQVSHYVAISKKTRDAEKLVLDYNRGFSKLKSNGTLNAISERHGTQVVPKPKNTKN